MDGPLHPWDVSPAEARQIQQRLRSLVRLEPPLDLDRVRVVAGVDVGYVQRGALATGCAAAVALSVSPGHLVDVESAVAIARACARGRSIMPQPTFLADARAREETRRLRTAPA